MNYGTRYCSQEKTADPPTYLRRAEDRYDIRPTLAIKTQLRPARSRVARPSFAKLAEAARAAFEANQ
jgi:hypothetical protein